MDAYHVVVFGHVAAAMGLFAALALEWLSLRNLSRAATHEQAREWASVWAVLMPLGMPAILIALASGIYLATTLGAWELGWVQPAVPALVVVAIAGAIVGPRRKRLGAALATGQGALSEALRAQLGHPLSMASWRFRTALLSGLVFEMSARPAAPGAAISLA
ncbi:MAG TPA: hypothetical protein VH208_12540, partial [Myxococcaceae bacterium]|nr:hypothetical protein [Myxococcaceae bacterium]